MSDVTQPNESGLTRRDLLKSGAVLGGALAWGAPVVQLIGMKPAMAQEVSGCPNTYCLKAEYDDGVLGPFINCSPGIARGSGRGNCLIPSEEDFDEGDFSGVPGAIFEGIVVSDCDGGDGIMLTLPVGCHLAGEDNASGSPDAFVGNVSAAAKCGRIGETNEDEGCDAPEIGVNGDGQTTLCFPKKCTNGSGLSHIELIICCS